MPPPVKRIRFNGNSIRQELIQEETIHLIKSLWAGSHEENETLQENGIRIINNPFPACVIRNFIADTDLLKSVIDDVKTVGFHEKNNDLYKFKQSEDVSNLRSSASIVSLHEILKTDCRRLISKILGDIELKELISATFSVYEHNDRLLCHDDKCGDRHVAFILYLVEDWKPEDGGSLQLFSSDSNNYPDKIVKEIHPEFNKLAFFEVTHTSFHQVSEVLTPNKARLSLNGWFHLKEKTLSEVECKKLELQRKFPNEADHNLAHYISSNYFEDENVAHIRKLFSASSEIQLSKILLPQTWQNLKNDFGSDHINWIAKGPPNIRKYFVADESTLPPYLSTIKNLFESKNWFNFLKAITSLDFAPSVNSDPNVWASGVLPSCNCEIQKWMPSNYTLIHDEDPEFQEEALDVVLRVPYHHDDGNEGDLEGYDAPESGHIIYIDGESRDEECLLHIGYKFNSLALVYRDPKTLRFTKYLHSKSMPFYQVFCTFYPWRPPADQPGLRHCEEEESATDDSSGEETGKEVEDIESDDE